VGLPIPPQKNCPVEQLLKLKRLGSTNARRRTRRRRKIRRRLLKRSALTLSTSRNVLSRLRITFRAFCGIFNDVVGDSDYIAVACSYRSFESSNLEGNLGKSRPLIE
jgi:hypothetical protein